MSAAQIMPSSGGLVGAILTERARCSRSNRCSGCASRCSGQKILGNVKFVCVGRRKIVSTA